MPKKSAPAAPETPLTPEVETPQKEVITIDVQPLMIPIAIIIAGALIAVAVYFGLRGQTSDGGKVNDTGATLTNSAETAVDLTAGSQIDKLVSLAEAIEIDDQEFRTCLEAERFSAEVKADLSAATSAGITGTPGFVVGRRGNDNTVTGVVIAGAYPFATFEAIIEHYLSGETSAPATAPELEAIRVATVSMDDDPVLGSTEAEVVIVEFSDYECPYCQRHYLQTAPELIKSYISTNKVAMVFRDLPLSFHDPAATREAIAAECVQELAGDDKYFEYHDLLFENTKTNGAGL